MGKHTGYCSRVREELTRLYKGYTMLDELRRAMERDAREENEEEDVIRKIRNVKPADTRWRINQGELPTDF